MFVRIGSFLFVLGFLLSHNNNEVCIRGNMNFIMVRVVLDVIERSEFKGWLVWMLLFVEAIGFKSLHLQ